MNSLDEKEKKLTSALEKLKNIKIDDANETPSVCMEDDRNRIGKPKRI